MKGKTTFQAQWHKMFFVEKQNICFPKLTLPLKAKYYSGLEKGEETEVVTLSVVCMVDVWLTFLQNGFSRSIHTHCNSCSFVDFLCILTLPLISFTLCVPVKYCNKK